MRTSEIRSRWLDYFAANGHEIRPSVSLVSPEPSILFTVAGMVPFIPYILGTEPAPWPTAASVQKCIRTNDIDNVGRTTRHGTFFQMNGNFSFGDYFKEGAIQHAWDLLTGPVGEGRYGLDGDRLWMTIWEKDDVSWDYLTRTLGVDPAHVQKLPFEEISWSTGQPGPAGACCEIHYDRGPQYGPDGGPLADTQGDRFLEIWNLVFDEFIRGEGQGHDFELVGKLDQTAIDTGAGLERLAFVLQDKPNMYEIDEVHPVIAAAEVMSAKTYGRGAAGPSAGADYENDVRMRVVADHVRSALMLIGDGVRPGNDGRGYVLRRLIRRAVRSMRLLGVEEAAMPTLLTASKDVMRLSYPELEERWSQISEVAYAEEDAFRRTLAAGTTILDTAVARAKAAASTTGGRAVVPGSVAFELHDTSGFPIDLTLEMAAEQGVAVDEDAFRALMTEQKERARADARAKKTGHADIRAFQDIEKAMGGGSTFLGYTESAADAVVTGLLVDGVPQPAATAPAEVEVILDRTPFYAEMGGQLADHGAIRLADGGVVEVTDVQAPIKGLTVHRGTLTEGTLAVGEKAYAEIDTARRLAIARAHTATHMVYAGLRRVVNEHADQAGSENSPSRLRFDFRHGAALSSAQLNDIEELVNTTLAQDLEVRTDVMSLDEARAQGAIALFGEKYGQLVRVVTIGDGFDRELCGGTHVATTGRIGRVALLGESSIGSGVRRIDALVGDGAYGYQAKEHALVSRLSTLVGSRAEDLPERIESLMSRLKDAEKRLAQAEQAAMVAKAAEVLGGVAKVGQYRLAAANLGTVGSGDALRSLVLDVRERLGEAEPVVVAAMGVVGERPLVVIATNQAARDAGARAGDLVKAAATALGGGGGGRPDLAQGGGQDATRLPEAMAAVTRALGA
ncbi:MULTISPECIES: alanine--tRNA ligase [unclassified Actinomyces]|uniref:alanine--tRNA ligase n=1 Tax=unclassified Actinomyces TaxID=2609248 RepID=UPI0020183341|nr:MULTISPECIES: alanine--tRNA ligase [unclassified Actinomyces]MCL3778324.1 alanine--tRNA ligase [Actinomyces sp. AC-20-1]MCL3789217.1 alanine--tRNA ligase [Actinomyces sp. 187325]MCL3791404.1 alanine--tRNA ligase [Actinomyces sp. 186855]MCL3793571.1 alanine--tRNA ligase [Actinomyces sp. 217892]